MDTHQYSIGDLARLAGISIRTLRHYDAIGLLKPSHRGDNSYRYYTEDDSKQLFDILFYRALGFALSEIGELLKRPVTDRQKQLLEQRVKLDAHITRLHQIRARLDALINDEENQSMSTDNRFAVFDSFDPDQYEEEVKERWSDTDAYKESARRTKKYNKDDWARYKSEADVLNQAMAALMAKGLSADDPAVLQVVEKMRLMIDTWFYPCPRAMHASLGEMYVQDERFAACYEQIRPGMAQFMRDATAASAR
ncbi:MAG: MerR family transcriptional regulator [Pseudohongiellaceae bacterium]